MKYTHGIKELTMASAIAALYVVLTFISAAMGLSSGVIQLRLSEVLCILPIFTPTAIPGLFIGCLISNLLTGAVLWDVIFGSLATLIGALGTYLLRKNKFIAAAMPVISNAVIVPFVLKYAYGSPDSIPFMILTVTLGEIAGAYILGLLFHNIIQKRCMHIFK